MRKQLRVEIVGVPCPDYQRRKQECIRLIADVLADQLIAKARAEVAAELGLTEDAIDRERHRDLPTLAELA